MTHKFTMVVGDWSGDGHNHRDEIVIECTHSKEEVEKAYYLACEDFDYDPIASLCTELEDNLIPADFAQKLRARGFPYDFEDDEKTQGYQLWQAEEWADIILFMAGTRLMDFTYDVINDGDKWDIGGYGIYRF